MVFQNEAILNKTDELQFTFFWTIFIK